MRLYSFQILIEPRSFARKSYLVVCASYKNMLLAPNGTHQTPLTALPGLDSPERRSQFLARAYRAA